MHRSNLALLAALSAAACSLSGAEVSGISALEYTRKAVDFGPRPPGSDANKALQAYIIGQLKSHNIQVIEDPFTATTPKGPVSLRFPARSLEILFPRLYPLT